MLFDRFESRIIVKGIIVARKPLHIGAGEDSTDPVQVDSSVLKDYAKRPLIPGASLKGVLRSRLEAILGSPGLEGWRSCNILSEKECCISHKKAKEIKGLYAKEETKKVAMDIYENSCDVCRLFGNGYLAAKLQIKDMYLVGDGISTERRDGVGIDRDSGTALRGAKYGFEIVPAGAGFDFYMVAENLDDRQRKLFDLILRLLKDGEISVGGSTSRGLGQIVLADPIEMDEINRDNIAGYYGL